MIDYFPQLLEGLRVSVLVTLASLALGLPLGLIAAIAMSARNGLLQRGVTFAVELGRGVPSLVLLQIFYFGLALNITSFLAAVLGLGLSTAAFTSEIYRGGLISVSTGEIEAAQALAMTPIDRYRYVIIPQALRIALPALMGHAITVFQGSALAYTIALQELLSVAYAIGARTFDYFSILLKAGVLYAAVCIPVAWSARRLERVLSRHIARN